MPTPTTTSVLDLRGLLDLRERVFPSFPQVARYFPSASTEDARQRLSRTIERGDGPGLVIGAAGTGKSLLLQVLAAQYHDRYDVVLLACARICTRRALLQTILFELGLPYRLRDEGELRLSLLDHLLSTEESPAGLLLLVDEAQALSLALLDELRVMTNLVRGGAPRVRLALTGSPALEESFAHPELESFSQRLSARCYLAPFNREETRQFIRAQVAASGGAPNIFSAEATDAVFDATDGVPRLVNQLCDRALLVAAARQRACIDRDEIQAAWADLQQLPTPWEVPTPAPSSAPSPQVIEFGQLDADASVDAPSPKSKPIALSPDDEAIEPKETVASVRQNAPSKVVAGDPFAEEFAEEEVVLDNFAAWDDMFHRATPRVDNQRDPGFASRVQAAIDASPISPEMDRDMPALAAVEISEADPIIDADDQRPIDEPPSEWPALRLAIVSEPSPLKPISLVAPSAIDTDATRRSGFDPVFPDAREVVEDWHDEVMGHLAPSYLATKAGEKAAMLPSIREADPVLIIEDDFPESAGSNPPVRREEYRHLFSRLRSG